ncbi:MAG: futalosine hydrolase [Chloroflexota bacterium]
MQTAPLIGIIAATGTEARAIAESFSRGEEAVIRRVWFCKGLLLGKLPAVLSASGIGKTNAAHAATLMIERFRPVRIYVIGVAGSYPSSGLALGEVVAAEQEAYGDEGLALRERFCTMSDLGLPLLVHSQTSLYNVLPMTIPEPFRDLGSGTFVTVSSCTGTLDRALVIERQFNAVCENMEGAAVAHVALMSGVPVTEIRAISNVITDRTAVGLDRRHIIAAAEQAQSAFLGRVGKVLQ